MTVDAFAQNTILFATAWLTNHDVISRLNIVRINRLWSRCGSRLNRNLWNIFLLWIWLWCRHGLRLRSWFRLRLWSINHYRLRLHRSNWGCRLVLWCNYFNRLRLWSRSNHHNILRSRSNILRLWLRNVHRRNRTRMILLEWLFSSDAVRCLERSTELLVSCKHGDVCSLDWEITVKNTLNHWFTHDIEERIIHIILSLIFRALELVDKT